VLPDQITTVAISACRSTSTNTLLYHWLGPIVVNFISSIQVYLWLEYILRSFLTRLDVLLRLAKLLWGHYRCVVDGTAFRDISIGHDRLRPLQLLLWVLLIVLINHIIIGHLSCGATLVAFNYMLEPDFTFRLTWNETRADVFADGWFALGHHGVKLLVVHWHHMSLDEVSWHLVLMVRLSCDIFDRRWLTAAIKGHMSSCHVEGLLKLRLVVWLDVWTFIWKVAVCSRWRSHISGDFPGIFLSQRDYGGCLLSILLLEY